jgi:PadR family transcriptional regulator AphA
MSLPHAILGMLRSGPMTGYELKTRCFDGSIAHFWPADQAQIYRTLERMTEQGLVASHLEIQQTRPNRREYRITDEGGAELDRWLGESQPLPAYRDPFLVQLYFANTLPPDRLDDLLVEQARMHEQRLAVYRAIPLPSLEELAGHREHLTARLTLELGITLEQAHLAWIERARDVLRDRPDGG